MDESSLNTLRHTESLPMDLRAWADECLLVTLALDAVHTVTHHNPPPRPAAPDRFSPSMLLTLLTYCYATDLTGSEDVEWASRNEAAVAYICARQHPDSDTLRRFRRANRSLIEQCLVHVFSQALAKRRVEQGTASEAGAGAARTTEADILRLVRRKLDLAVMMDTAACE